jgi:esterase/lipase superfamily enzyme
MEDERADKHFLLLELSKLTEDDFYDQVGASCDSALVFVHGYNNSFQDAIFKAAQIAFDTNFPGKVIAFCWPSAASPELYDYDRDKALLSPDTLFHLLRRMKTEAKVKDLFIIAHSLGSQIVVDALDRAILSNVELSLREVIFAAPDVARDVFTERAHRIAGLNAGITLYASSADKCLIASKVKAGGMPRAGDIPAIGPLLLDGVDLIDATLLGDDIFKLNHEISNRSVLDDMGRIVLSQTRPPHVRTPTLRRMPDRTSTKYWMYPL